MRGENFLKHSLTYSADRSLRILDVTEFHYLICLETFYERLSPRLVHHDYKLSSAIGERR